MQVTVDMCSRDMDREEYGTEVMCAGWNPEIRAMGEATVGLAARFVALQAQQARETQREMPTGVAEMDIEAFLRKMYAAQG